MISKIFITSYQILVLTWFLWGDNANGFINDASLICWTCVLGSALACRSPLADSNQLKFKNLSLMSIVTANSQKFMKKNKMRKTARYLKSYQKSEKSLHILDLPSAMWLIAERNEIKIIIIKLDVKTRWGSTFEMLNGFMRRIEPINSFLEKIFLEWLSVRNK